MPPPPPPSPLKSWLAAHWVAGALMMAVLLLALLPVGAGAGTKGELFVYLSLPAYMLHQVEEHSGDRFRAFVNAHLFKGADVLTTSDVLWINLPGVWGVNLVSLYAAAFAGAGWGFTALYLMLVNGVTHVMSGLALRSYNPGLVTSVFIFLPLSIAGIVLVPASLAQNFLGLAIALAIHAAIIAHILREARRLKSAARAA